MHYDRTIAIVFTAGVGIKTAMLSLEANDKRDILRSKYRDYPPEATSGIFNRSLFWWQNELFLKGFRKLLFIDDLFTLDKHLTSEHLQDLFQSAWNKGAATLLSHFVDVI